LPKVPIPSKLRQLLHANYIKLTNSTASAVALDEINILFYSYEGGYQNTYQQATRKEPRAGHHEFICER
jgi:hypothetical protein